MLSSIETIFRVKALMDHLDIDEDGLNKLIRVPGLSITRLNRMLKKPHLANLEVSELNAFHDLLLKHHFISETNAKIRTLNYFKDYMYLALIRYLGYNADTEKETKTITPGCYLLYRPSLKIPDMFTVGSMNITIDPLSGALCVEEIHKFKGSGEHKYGSITNEKAIDERFHGYMIRKRRRYICFQRNKLDKNSNFIVTIFNDEFLTGDVDPRIASLGGVCFGTSGSRMYISRVFIERVDNDIEYNDLINELNYVRANELKPSVLRNLVMPSGDYYYVF